MNATTEIPAERTVDGIGLQRVHVIKDGQPIRLVTVPGSVKRARLYAALQTMHPATHANYAETVALLHRTK